MPSTFQALGVALLALLPGALYEPALLLGYLAGPFALGRFTALGHRYRSRHSVSAWERFVVWVVNLYPDAAPAPRAWDFLFGYRGRRGWIIAHLKDGSHIGGAWTSSSYAAGYPDDQDLYLSDQVELTTDVRFRLGDDALPRSLGKSLLIRWGEVRYLDFYAA